MSFEKALQEVLKNEGGYVDHPSDRGGKTNRGITQKTLSDFLGRDATEEEIQNISMDTVRQIYKQNYWDRLSLDKVKDTILAGMLFDQAVNRGTRKVAEQIQAALGVKVDGVIGPITLKAINERDPKKFMIEFVKRAQLSYCDIVASNPSQVVFLKGWIKRTHGYLDA